MTNLQNYIDILFPNKIADVVEREKKISSLTPSLINIAIYGVLVAVLSTIFYQYVYAPPAELPAATAQQIMSLFSWIKLPVNFLQPLVFFYIGTYVAFWLAKAFGGKGSFELQAYAASVLQLVGGSALMLLGFLSTVPLILCILSFVVIALSVYFAYLNYRIIMAVHKQLSREKGIAVIVLQFLINLVIAFAFVTLRQGLGF
jgi:hypothetical protein